VRLHARSPSIGYFAPATSESRPMLTKQMIQAYFDTSFCLRLCKSGRFIESPRCPATSGLPPETDIPIPGRHVSNVPETDSLNYLI
jgi:hypothetical protein